jgi:WD40 repeat protein
MNPGGGPFKQLAKSLVASDIYDSEEADVHLKLNATLRRSRLGLVEAIRQAKLPEGTNFLLVVDQFEEIFRYSEAGEEEGEAADDFISMILESTKQSNIPIYVIITMRSDYIGDCSKFEGLPEEINEGEYLIPRLSREEYKSVIEGPVRVGGAKLAPRLMQRLLNDIGTESDQLPCLQHALMRTWDAWVERDEGEELDLEDYRAIGGMGEALSIHADEIFDTFSDKGTRETATRMFRAITEKGDDNRGIRRPLRLQQLADITNHSIEEVRSVVDPYRQQGVTFLTPPSSRALDPKTVIDISHESLMRVWGRLRNWVEEEAQSARIYKRLVDTSSLWKKGEAGLYHDPDLQIAQSWRDEYEPNYAWANLYGGGFEVATEFLEASEEEGRKAEREKELARQKELEQAQELAETRERSARNMKRFASVVGIVAVIALGAMVFAVKQQKAAETAQKTAIEAKGLAEAAKETLRKEFISSDINLGNSFSNQNQIGRGLAHFARALERDPDNAEIIDKSFNLLAYSKPPGYIPPSLKNEFNYINTSRATSDGTNVLTGIFHGDDDTDLTPNLFIWEPNSKNPKYSLYVGPGSFRWGNDIDISPDGKTAVLGLNGVHLLNIEDGTTKQIFESRRARAVSFSTDGTKILTTSGGNAGSAFILDAQTGEQKGSYQTKSFLAEWSPDETKLFFGGHRRGKSAVYDLVTNETKDFIHEGAPQMTPFGGFDRLGKRILTISQDQRFNIWDVESGKLEYYVTHNRLDSGFPGAVGVFTPDNQKLITVANDLFVRLWDANDGTPLDAVNIPSGHAFGQKPVFSEDGVRFVIPLKNGQAVIGTFNDDYASLPKFSKSVPITEAYAFLANNGKIRPLLLPLANISAGSVSNKDGEMILATSEGKARVFDIKTGEPLSEEIAHSGVINAIGQSPDASKIAISERSGTVKIWDRENLKVPMRVIRAGENTSNNIDLQKVHFTSDGKSVWISSPNESKKWDISTGEILIDSKTYPTRSLSKSSDDGRFTAITTGGELKLYDNNLASTEPILEKKLGQRIDAACFSNDNKYIIIGTAQGKVLVFSTDKRLLERTFSLNVGSVTENVDSLAVNKEFSQIAVGCKSGNLYLLDFDEGDNQKRTVPRGEIFRSELKTRESKNQEVKIDVDITNAKNLYLVVEDGGDQWQHDVANWIEPKIIVNNEEILLTSLEWMKATASWGSVKINKNVANDFLEVGGKRYSNGIGTHSVSVIEYELPKGATRFKSVAGIDNKAFSFNDGNSLSSVRFSIHTNYEPNFSKEYQSYKGEAPCSDVSFNSTGEVVAATFNDGKKSYLQLWSIKSGEALTGKLSNGSSISRSTFINEDLQIVAWPDGRNGGISGRASVWDVSIRGDFKPNQKYAEIIKGLGKEELDEDSKPVNTENILNKLDLISDLGDSSRFGTFLNWQKLFPSKRGDSPFRPRPSKSYIENLITQNDYYHLDEAVRLSPHNPVAIAKRGALRLLENEYPGDGLKVKSYADAINSFLLAPSNAYVQSLSGAIRFFLGDKIIGRKLLDLDENLNKLKAYELLSLIEIQEGLKVDASIRRKYINHALADRVDLDHSVKKDLIIKRIKLASDSGSFEGVASDWKEIKEWDKAPDGSSIDELFELYLSSLQNRAEGLVENGLYKEAIELVKPGAIASLSLSAGQIHPLIVKLLEWEYREKPSFTLIEKNAVWKYLDDGTDPGVDWFNPNVGTDGWSEGKAKLGYGEDGEVTILNYGGDLENKHITYYFKKKFIFEGQNQPSVLIANIIRDDGIIVYLNGEEVVRNNMPGGPVNYLTNASITADAGGTETSILPFSIDGNLLKKGENIIAAEIHQKNGLSSDIGFQLELLGSNQDVSGYLLDLVNSREGSKILPTAIEMIPKKHRNDCASAFESLLGGSGFEEAPMGAVSSAISIGEKLKKDKDLRSRLISAIERKVKLLEENPTSANLVERVRILQQEGVLLASEGANQADLSNLEKRIYSPPRDPNLSAKQIDLRLHFNASMFYHEYWAGGGGEWADLRFLPEKMNGDIVFDLRGIIQLNSGLYEDGNTANEDWFKRANRSYPNAVENIQVNSRSDKIHFLVGGVFARNMEAGATAMIATINYEDETTSVFEFKAREDLFDWWQTDLANGVAKEKIGFLGQNNLGQNRLLTKPFWVNPHPEKVISHIDLTGGLINGAPFVVGITLE